MNTVFMSQQIKQMVTMPEMLSRYGINAGRKHRIPCPIHNGHDDNFSYNDNAFKCWVCGASGDVISFVMQMFNLDFRQALQRINYDFSLGLSVGNQPTLKQRREQQRQMAEYREKQRTIKEETERINNNYWSAFDELMRLSEQKKIYKPMPQDSALHSKFVEVLQSFEATQYRLDCAEAERMAYGK